MERREFLKLSPALPVGAVTASLVLREDGKEPIALDVSVLKVQAGDTLVLHATGYISQENVNRLRACVQSEWPDLKVMILGEGLKLDGVMRVT